MSFVQHRPIEHVASLWPSYYSLQSQISDLSSQVQRLERKVKRANARIQEMESKLYYAPPGPGYLQALSSFQRQGRRMEKRGKSAAARKKKRKRNE